MSPFSAFIRRRSGATLVEYGTLVGLISAVSITAVAALGDRVDFNYLIGALEVYAIDEELENYLVNGDFSNVTGTTSTNWGYFSYNVAGWEEISGDGLAFELHDSGRQGVDSVTDSYWLDTNASPGGLTIAQSVAGLEDGNVYKITLFAADRDPDLDGEADVYWNGIRKGTLDPTIEDEMQPFTFYIQSGEGDGSDRVLIIDTGSNDSNGLSLDQVRIFGP